MNLKSYVHGSTFHLKMQVLFLILSSKKENFL